jgi:hypothetical protein
MCIKACIPQTRLVCLSYGNPTNYQLAILMRVSLQHFLPEKLPLELVSLLFVHKTRIRGKTLLASRLDYLLN